MTDNSTINLSLPTSLLEAADRQAGVEFRNRSDLMREALREYLLNKESEGGKGFTKLENHRIEDILNFSDFLESRVILLSACFRPQPNQVKEIFAGNESPVTKLLENPPTLRSMGWDMQTLDHARPVAGEYLQVKNGDRKVIRVYRDGEIILAADDGFLGFGVNNEEATFFSFNGMAITELIVNFLNFVNELSKYLETTPDFAYVGLKLINHKKDIVHLQTPFRGQLFSEDKGTLELDLAEREIQIPLGKNFSLGKCAYQLLAELYYFFGLSEDQFRYVKKETKEIDLVVFKDR